MMRKSRFVVNWMAANSNSNVRSLLGFTAQNPAVAPQRHRLVGEVQLHSGVPVANAILTTDTDEKAEVRMNVKGAEAALVAIEMAHMLKALA